MNEMKISKRFAIAGLLAAALVAAPTTAQAAQADQTDGLCKIGIVLPARLAITGYGTEYGVRLVGDTTCFSFVTWDVSVGLISTGQTISFWRPNTSGFVGGITRPTSVHAIPRQGSYSYVTYTDPTTNAVRTYSVVESSSNTMVARYDSRIAWRSPKHIGRMVKLKAAVASVGESTVVFGNYAAWVKAKVLFQRKHAGKWQTVATARTDKNGSVHATVKYRKGEWRAVSADSGTTWGRTTGTHKL
jgi:hypothetical protein